MTKGELGRSMRLSLIRIKLSFSTQFHSNSPSLMVTCGIPKLNNIIPETERSEAYKTISSSATRYCGQFEKILTERAAHEK